MVSLSDLDPTYSKGTVGGAVDKIGDEISRGVDYVEENPSVLLGNPALLTDRLFRDTLGSRQTNQLYGGAAAAAGGFWLGGGVGAAMGGSKAFELSNQYNAMRSQEQAQEQAAAVRARSNAMQRAQAQAQMAINRRRAMAQMRAAQGANLSTAQATGTLNSSAFSGSQAALQSSTAGSISRAEGQQRTQQATFDANQSAQGYLIRGQRQADRYQTMASLGRTGFGIGLSMI